jgi:cell shape-determining protein MreC
MQDVGQVLRRKRAQQAQLAKEIELLQTVEEKLREVAPLLADSEDENAVLAEVDEEIGQSASPAAKSAAASVGSQSSATPSESGQSTRPLALRWP